MNYHRKLEDKTRLTIDGKRYRVGNPSHPYYDLYKKHGIEAVFESMGLAEAKPPPEEELDFPWSSVVFGIVIVVIILAHTVGS